MFEHRTHHLLSWPTFLRRAARHLLFGILIVGAALLVGIVGYHVLGGLGWVDAFLNASMILGGMGPVDRLETDAAKIFAAFYALFSGLVLIAVMGVVLAPWLHRLLHAFHLDRS
jgi:hypothetical protein